MNRLRGEVEMTLGGKTYTMRPTLGTLCDVEQITGKTITQIASEVITKQAMARDQIAVVWAGIKAGLKDGEVCPTLDAVGELIFDEGFPLIQEPMVQLLADLIEFYTGKQKGSGKAEKPKTS